MRMRRKKHGAERIAACSDLLITEYERLKEAPQFSFPKEAPLRLEIGCGKGDFACGTAENNPDINLIAMERVADVACLALEKAKERAEKQIILLEKELEDLDAELFGEAATNYQRAAEIEERKSQIEEELLELYELTMQ